MTQANVGGALRSGWDLSHNFCMPSLIQGVSSLDRMPENSVSFYSVLTVQRRAVGHNMFLDGNTFHDSHREDKSILSLMLVLELRYWFGGLNWSSAPRSEPVNLKLKINKAALVRCRYRSKLPFKR